MRNECGNSNRERKRDCVKERSKEIVIDLKDFVAVVFDST